MYFNGTKDISVLEVTLDGGREKGLSAILVRNKGFECMIVKDHALDIAQASFMGVGVSFISRNGLTYQKNAFLKSFEGGLIYTCGLDSVSECVEGIYPHGTLHTTPATRVSYAVQDDVVLVRGDVEVTGLFCESLTLHREICVSCDGVTLTDRIENTHSQAGDYCLLYHCNFGAPFLADGGKVGIDYLTREGLTPYAAQTEALADRITAPVPGAEEAVFYHTVAKGRAEYVNSACGLGVEITYDQEKQPFLLEWKSMATDDYALGLEPSTTRFDSFQKKPIAPGEVHEYVLNVKFKQI